MDIRDLLHVLAGPKYDDGNGYLKRGSSDLANRLLPIREEELRGLLRSGTLKVVVYGLGLVGSAITAAWLRFGAHVVGVDKNPSVVERANKGLGPMGEPLISEAYLKGLEEGRFEATTEGDGESREAKIKFVAVPVSWSSRGLEISMLMSVIRTIASNISEDDVVIVKPTIPIGTSRKVVVPLLSSSGLLPDDDFLYIYSPERISAGRAVSDIEEHYPAIVSGVGPKSLDFARSLYGLIAKAGVICMKSLEAAEAEKIYEGIYRDVNIALANELAIIADGLGLDFEEIRTAANSQPYSHIHKPGLGVGGACIPIYPWFLVKNALEVGVIPELVLTARRMNDNMPGYFASMAERYMGGLMGKRVAVLGLAFRGDVADKRLSPTYDLVAELLKRGASVTVHDPYFDDDELLSRISVRVTRSLTEALRGADLIIVATDHSEYTSLSDRILISASGGRPLVLDSRRILNPAMFKDLKLVQPASGRKVK